MAFESQMYSSCQSYLITLSYTVYKVFPELSLVIHSVLRFYLSNLISNSLHIYWISNVSGFSPTFL